MENVELDIKLDEVKIEIPKKASVKTASYTNQIRTFVSKMPDGSSFLMEEKFLPNRLLVQVISTLRKEFPTRELTLRKNVVTENGTRVIKSTRVWCRIIEPTTEA